MECFIVQPEDVAGETLLLRDEEAHHAIRSLRLRSGDALLATNLIGTCYRCLLSDDDRDATWASCSIQEILPEFGEPAREVLLIQGFISQPARWEFLIEKATELGVRTIAPVITEHTERAHYKADRSERILRAAVKQTKRARKPGIRLSGLGEFTTLETALVEASKEDRSIFLLHEAAQGNSVGLTERVATLPDSKAIAVVVGPEGGFSDEEVARAAGEYGAQILSLGPRRLRAETAAIAALAIVIE